MLQQTYYMQERAVSLAPANAEYVIELGYEELLRRRTKEAHKCFQNAMKLNESSVEALTGEGSACVMSDGDVLFK